MKAVKAAFRSHGRGDEEYAHFKQALRAALQMAKQSEQAASAAAGGAGGGGGDEQKRAALAEIQGLFAPAHLAPLAVKLKPLLPPTLASMWWTAA